MAKLVLDLVNETELILEKDKTGTVKISYRTTSPISGCQSQVCEIGSLSYSDITLLETFLAIEKFPQIAIPSPKPIESGEWIEKLLKVLETYLAKIVEKQPRDYSARGQEVEQKKSVKKK